MNTQTKKELREKLAEQAELVSKLRGWLDEARTSTEKANSKMHEMQQSIPDSADSLRFCAGSNRYWHGGADHYLRGYTFTEGAERELLFSVPVHFECIYSATEGAESEQLAKLIKARNALAELFDSWPDEYVDIDLVTSKRYVNII